MFGRNREDVQSRGRLFRAELGQSWDHALRAAGHAATGVRSTVGPRVAPAAARVRGAATNGWGSTRAAFRPLGEAAQQQVKRGQKRSGKQGGQVAGRRWPKVAGLLAGGALVGGTAAFIVRRRRQQQWEEYDPTVTVSGLAEAAEEAEAAGAPGPTGLGEEQPAVSDNRRI